MSAGQRFEAGAVVVAAGSWSSELLEPLGLNLTVIPARGQMIALRGATCPISRVIHSSKVYVVPRRDGRVLIGATVEYAGFRKAVTAEGITRLLTAAIEVVPQLKESEIVESWSGLRPDTIDHLPITGPSGIADLWLATGHFRNGILLAPVTAGAITASIEFGRTSDQLAPFGIERFEARGCRLTTFN
jgi:glycine oxidase